jgi:hypothetical protein
MKCLLLLASKGHEGYRQELPGERLAIRFSLAIDQAADVGSANDRRDLALAVYYIPAAAQFAGDGKTGRAIHVQIIAHRLVLYPEKCDCGELQCSRVLGVIDSDLDCQKDGFVGFSQRLSRQQHFVGITQPFQCGREVVIALDDTAKPLLQLAFHRSFWHNERQNLAGCFVWLNHDYSLMGGVKIVEAGLKAATPKF